MYSNKKTSRNKLIFIICSLLLVVLILAYFLRTPILIYLYKNFKVPAPKINSAWKTASESITQGDFYVSKNGSDSNDGTQQSPFLTINRALQAVESVNKTNKSEIIVCIESGTYSIDSLNFSEEHGGNENCRIIYISYGNGEVILNSGANIDPNDFVKAEKYPEIYQRLSEKAKNNVYVVDLTKVPYCLGERDFGKMYPIGTYNTANRYHGDTTGPMYSELFINGIRQNPARYPNSGYIYTDSVVSSGKDIENKPNGDPAGDVFAVNDALASRIQSWSDLENVWMYGFWQHDWADGSTPIESFNTENNHLTTKYQSFFGIRKNAPYYFYNCLEELDFDDEWYLDRENGLLCVYRSSGIKDSEINISLSTESAITVNANFVTLKNLTVTGTRGNGIIVNGNGNIIEDCKIENIGGHAIQVFGNDNLITKNEIANIGKSGISASGGDKTTLLPGNNIISNNLIHDWSQIFKTYQAGIILEGVGNTCANNELFNSPHLAITYSGNNHIVEYNLIHDVCLEVDDAGAIYAGKSWSSYGNDIRYNLIYDIGSSKYYPNGIYMDDALSGQNIYGNILINIPKHAIFIGGGRDMNVYDNLIINSGYGAIRYDSRARDGMLKETWFSANIDDLWNTLHNSPWKSEIWQATFPQYKAISDDIININDPSFMANPSNSIIKNNIVFDKIASIGTIDESVYNYSTVSSNKTYYLFQLKKSFKNYKDGNYLIDEQSATYNKSFNDVLEKVGRY